MLLAEDVLLLPTDGASGRPLVGSPGKDYVIAGAVLLDLAELGRVRVGGRGRDDRRRRGHHRRRRLSPRPRVGGLTLPRRAGSIPP